jgi:hypothetical protein
MGFSRGGLLPELLGEPDENSFGTPDVADPVDVFVIDNFIDHRRTELAEPGKGVIDVLDGNMTRKYPNEFTGAVR